MRFLLNANKMCLIYRIAMRYLSVEMENHSDKHSVLVTLPEDLMQRVQSIAHVSGMTADDLVNQLIKGFLDAGPGHGDSKRATMAVLPGGEHARP